MLCAKNINRTTIKNVESYCNKENVSLIYLEGEDMREITLRNIKALGITDSNLADAIRQNYRVGADE